MAAQEGLRMGGGGRSVLITSGTMASQQFAVTGGVTAVRYRSGEVVRRVRCMCVQNVVAGKLAGIV